MRKLFRCKKGEVNTIFWSVVIVSSLVAVHFAPQWRAVEAPKRHAAKFNIPLEEAKVITSGMTDEQLIERYFADGPVNPAWVKWKGDKDKYPNYGIALINNVDEKGNPLEVEVAFNEQIE